MSIRFKLTITAVAVILIANSLLSAIALQYLNRVWMREVQTRVQRNLGSARAAYQKRIELIEAFLAGRVLDHALTLAAGRADQAELETVLNDIHRSGRMDLVVLLDQNAPARVRRVFAVAQGRK